MMPLKPWKWEYKCDENGKLIAIHLIGSNPHPEDPVVLSIREDWFHFLAHTDPGQERLHHIAAAVNADTHLELCKELEVAIDLIKQFMAYSEEMRKIGRGLSGTDKNGMTFEYSLRYMEQALAAAKEKYNYAKLGNLVVTRG